MTHSSSLHLRSNAQSDAKRVNLVRAVNHAIPAIARSIVDNMPGYEYAIGDVYGDHGLVNLVIQRKGLSIEERFEGDNTMILTFACYADGMQFVDFTSAPVSDSFTTTENDLNLVLSDIPVNAGAGWFIAAMQRQANALASA